MSSDEMLATRSSRTPSFHPTTRHLSKPPHNVINQPELKHWPNNISFKGDMGKTEECNNAETLKVGGN